jgi:hypothetical protein
MNIYIVMMISVLIWVVVMALGISWVYDVDSGWDEVKLLKAPFLKRMILLIP